MNPLYQMFGNAPVQKATPVSNMNPIQRMNFIRQAMANPAMLIRQQFPDIPEQIMNNPAQILQYLQQTRGITNQQIQQLINQYGGI